MELFVTGLSHKTAPIEVRERLAFSGDALELALSKIRKLPGVLEAVVLSTCNRTEVYGLSAHAADGAAQVAECLGERSASDLGPHLYVRTGDDALTHLFRVAASLDSMVLGEPQILGQVKEAYAAARTHRAAGHQLERIFSRAFQVAKRVRNETSVGENAVSMSFVAVELARKIFGSLDGRSVLLVGAGKMCELAATHLHSNGVRRVLVANRSLARGQELARKFGGDARPLSEVASLLEEVDIVLSSTAAPGFLITRDMMAKVIKARRYRPIFLIDLAVPRDIDPGVNDLASTYAYDVDDLEKVVQENRDQRAHEAGRADRLVQAEVAAFGDEVRAQRVRPVLAVWRHHAARIADREAERTLADLSDLGLTERQADGIRAMARAVVNKLLHEPTLALRNGAGAEHGEQLAAMVASLFALDVEGTVAEIQAEKARRREAQALAIAEHEVALAEAEQRLAEAERHLAETRARVEARRVARQLEATAGLPATPAHEPVVPDAAATAVPSSPDADAPTESAPNALSDDDRVVPISRTGSS